MSNLNVKNLNFNSTRNLANQGNFMFFETSLDVCKLEYNLIDFSSLDSDVTINIADFEGGEGRQLSLLSDHIQEKTGVKPKCYYSDIDKGRYNYVKDMYSDKFEKIMNIDATKSRIGVANENASNGRLTVDTKCMAVIRDNPPYGLVDDENGVPERIDKKIIFKNTQNLIAGGIHLIELPIDVAKDSLKMLLTRYIIPCIAKFPKEEYKKFKQVVIFAKLKTTKKPNKELEKQYLELFKNDELPYLDEIKDHVIKLNEWTINESSSKNINYFREPKVTEESLISGLTQVKDDLFHEFRKIIKKPQIAADKTPLMALSPGHHSTLFMSGYYDGILGDLLVRGGVNKETITSNYIDEDDKKITEIVDVFVPFLELTNKNGETVYRRFDNQTQNEEECN